MDFRIWLEAKFDPSTTQLYKYEAPSKHLGRSFGLRIDNTGNVIPSDYEYRGPYMRIEPIPKLISLQRLSPQAPDFRKMINALRSKYHDIDNWDVSWFGQAGHMKTGNKKYYRKVAYWMRQNVVDVNNKLPEYFYHGTSTNQWYGGINKIGLVPRSISGSAGSYGAQNVSSLSQEDLIYLSTHPDAATREAAQQASEKHGGQPMILRVSSRGLFPEKLTPDEDASRMRDKAITAQDSINRMSSFAYRGRIGRSAIEPYLLGKRELENNHYETKWEKFRDIPEGEHPITNQLKQNRLPDYQSAAYYALKDAGIIGSEERTDSFGHTQDWDVVKRQVSDKEIKEILKNSKWANNVRFIMKDLGDGYQGAIRPLKYIHYDAETLTQEQQKVMKMLTDSGLVTIYSPDEIYVLDWKPEKAAIKLAKLMGKMSFSKLAEIVRSIKRNVGD